MAQAAHCDGPVNSETSAAQVLAEKRRRCKPCAGSNRAPAYGLTSQTRAAQGLNRVHWSPDETQLTSDAADAATRPANGRASQSRAATGPLPGTAHLGSLSGYVYHILIA